MVKPGFKQTEIGEIPEDWDLRAIGDSYEFKNGLNKEKKYFGHGTPIINYMDVYNYSGLKKTDIEGKVDVTSEEKRAYSARKGDLFFTRTSETVDEIGTASTLLDDIDEAVFSGFVLRARPKDEIFDLQFQKYCLKSEAVRKQIKSTSSYTTRALTNGRLLSAVLVPTPIVKNEQKAIAKALSDVDELIVSLEKLIAKKRDIKTATMQQLLTGKKRLPGFGEGKGTKLTELGEIPEDWEVKTYNDIFLFLTTASNSRADLSENGDVYYIHYGDIHTKFEFMVNFDREEVPKIESYKLKGATFIQDGDLIMADASEDYEGIGKSVEVNGLKGQKAISGLHTFLLRDKENLFAPGFKGYLHSITPVKRSFDRLATGLKVYGLSKNNLKQVLVPVPSIDEQMEIISVIAAMEANIEALESRLNKTKAIKEAMMQELLTGRTRLIDTTMP